MADTHSWLAELKSDGINLGLQELMYYQSQTALADLTPRKTPSASLAGAYLSRHKGRGMEFDEARHYQPGDDIRAIDWRVTARTGKTHTKVYREERERPVYIVCDLSSSMHFGTQLLFKSVQAAHLAALLSWTSVKRGDKVGALLFTDEAHRECKPIARKKGVLNICQQLLSLHQNQKAAQVAGSSTALVDACARLRRLAKPGSTVFVISDFAQHSDAVKRHLADIGRHCEVNAYCVSDPFEVSLPTSRVVQSVNVTDGVTKQRWMLGDRKLSQDYNRTRQAHYQQVKDDLTSANVHVENISAGLPLAQQLVKTGRQR